MSVKKILTGIILGGALALGVAIKDSNAQTKPQYQNISGKIIDMDEDYEKNIDYSKSFCKMIKDSNGFEFGASYDVRYGVIRCLQIYHTYKGRSYLLEARSYGDDSLTSSLEKFLVSPEEMASPIMIKFGNLSSSELEKIYNEVYKKGIDCEEYFKDTEYEDLLKSIEEKSNFDN